MLEPLGQSQVLGYLRQLAVVYQIHLITFEKRADWNDVQLRTRLRAEATAAGIEWRPLRYHKRPSALATAFDIFQGTMLGAYIVLRYGAGLVHARSYVPSVMA